MLLLVLCLNLIGNVLETMISVIELLLAVVLNFVQLVHTRIDVGQTKNFVDKWMIGW